MRRTSSWKHLRLVWTEDNDTSHPLLTDQIDVFLHLMRNPQTGWGMQYPASRSPRHSLALALSLERPFSSISLSLQNISLSHTLPQSKPILDACLT